MRATAALIAAAVLVLAACSDGAEPDADATTAAPSSTAPPSTEPSSAAPSPTGSGTPSPSRPAEPTVVGTVATGLEAPWGLAFLPDGTALVSERDSSRVVAVTGDGVREVGRVDAAAPQGEAGLLGLAVSPTFADDGLIYAYVSTAEDNRVLRMPYDGQRLGAPSPVLTGIPNGFIHDGGRLLFDDDGMLLVSTGEAGDPPIAQDRSSLGGKVLRITPDGDPAPGNPDPESPVLTLGHRNVQGLAVDGDQRLWATEFGQNTWDELNLLEPGSNYGWPLVEGEGGGDEYVDPAAVWATTDASPSGLAFASGSLWAGALRGERLWEIPVTGAGAGEPRAWFVGDYGRIRTVAVAPSGNLWVTTSNRDGRGDPAEQDDRILEIAIP